MRLFIRHETKYSYESGPAYTVQRLHLTPVNFDSQRTISWSITAPGIERALAYRDGFGNDVHLVTFNAPGDHVLIVAEGIVECTDAKGLVRGLPQSAPELVFLRQTPSTLPNGGMRSIAEKTKADSSDRIEQLHAIMNAVHERVAYELGVTHAFTTGAQAFDDGRGVCQDHAHIFLGIARLIGIPARYVSGYLITDEFLNATASHAWAEALVPGLGWIGFDAANAVCPTDHYVRVAAGIDAASITPVKGTRRGGMGENMAVEVKVQVAEQ